MIDPEVMARIAERKIQEAIEEGKFDNLPGKGKPLELDDDPGAPLPMRLANKVLKNAGMLPDWMMVQRDIVEERQEATSQRARLIREGELRRARLQGLPAEHSDIRKFAEWHARSRAQYLRRLKSVNTSILKFCMMAPSTAAAFAPYKIEREMAEFDAAFPTLEQAPDPSTVVVSDTKGSHLKKMARERYQQGGGEVRGWAKAASLLGFGQTQGANDVVGDMATEDMRTTGGPDNGAR